MATANSIKLRLSDRAIDAQIKNHDLPVSIKDEQHTGLQIDIDAQGKGAWRINKRINGKLHNRIIGLRSELSIKQARDLFLEQCLAARHGKHEQLLQKKAASTVTLQQALEQMLQRGEYRPSTAKSYQHLIIENGGLLYRQKDKPLTDITPELLQKLYKERSQTSESMASRDARTLRLLWNWASKNLGIEGDNPVNILNKSEKVSGDKGSGWNKPKRKKNIIYRRKLEQWFKAIRDLQQVNDETLCRQSYAAELMLLTGLRRSEILKMQWRWVDWNQDSITWPAEIAKNGDELTRPMTHRVKEILLALKDKNIIYVFAQPKKGTKHPYLSSIQSALTQVQLITGIHATPNDLRRTMASAADAAGVGLTITKALMNHRTGQGGGDVTQGYINTSDLETMLETSQKIENFILGHAGFEVSVIDKLTTELSGLSSADKNKLLALLQK